MKRILESCFAAFLALNVFASDPVISDVTVRQRWPWSRLVDIDYVLTCDELQSVDVAVIATDGSTPLTLPADSLTGDRVNVTRGLHRIVWDPLKTVYTNTTMLTQFSVTLMQTLTPVYMIVDLNAAAGDTNQIEYIYPGDARLKTQGHFTNVWFSVTNDSTYATTKLVLRRIRSGIFAMGSSAVSTTLTKDFYAGVFEVTQRQWELIMGTKPSYYNNATFYASRPVEQVTYEDIRGATNSTPSVNWPVTDRTVVSATGFLGKLRAKTGLNGLDLPTDAQWEYVCRAGTTTVFNDGNSMANVSGSNAVTNSWLNALGRYKFDGGCLESGANPAQGCDITNATAPVGSYLPNGWGVYDMHGNVFEWCLDWYASSLSGGVDPVGAASGTARVPRSGSWSYTADKCTSTYRHNSSPTTKSASIGFRLVMTLP